MITHKHYEPLTPVQYLKGVGPKMAERLSKLGIATLEDLLYHYPRDWEDRRQFKPLKDVKAGEETTYRGVLHIVNFQETKRGFALVTAVIRDGTGELVCKWLRKKSWRFDVLEAFRKELVPGAKILVHGMVARDFAGLSMTVDEHDVFTGSEEDHIHIDRIVPIYPATEGVTPKFLRKIMHEAVQHTVPADPLPAAVAREQKLMPLPAAIRGIHFPESMPEKDAARARLAFQELFTTQAVLALARIRMREKRGEKRVVRKHLLTPFRAKLGFDFTHSQKKVINEIFEDMTSEYPMMRLLQGDVGSGKTVVALSAMLLACENKTQAALMAPTEILAEQHYINIRHMLEGLPVNVGLLTSSVKGRERAAFLSKVASGEIHIAVGTHALLEPEIQFAHCGLAVIDEQHRFGVRHRLELTRRKPAPDVLVMTATPIPRTLALSLYGDLDVSTIDELPPGRQKIQTLRAKEEEAYSMVRREVAQGRQAYLVYPLVDESSKVELKAAVAEFERLKARVFPDLSIGLLHGQMPGREKERVMREFHAGAYKILAATTIIEVGIDVPNATVMLIQHAERFGLSTLHQLRGRVGRGAHASYCILVADTRGEEARKRVDIVLGTQNGFTLAEEDLKLRGPGEIFGTSQHGLPPFRIASFLTDTEMMALSRDVARDWVAQDPALERQENAALREYLRKHFSKNWHWGGIA